MHTYIHHMLIHSYAHTLTHSCIHSFIHTSPRDAARRCKGRAKRDLLAAGGLRPISGPYHAERRKELRGRATKRWRGRAGEGARGRASCDLITPKEGGPALRPISGLGFWISEGLDSGIILMSRGGFLLSIGKSPDIWSQRISAGTILVGRVGVLGSKDFTPEPAKGESPLEGVTDNSGENPPGKWQPLG